MNATTGTMGGYFVMRRHDGELFHAVVPTMTFTMPSPIEEPAQY